MNSSTISAAIRMSKRWGLLKTLYFYFARFCEKYLRINGSLCLIFSTPLLNEEDDDCDTPNPSKVLTNEELIAYSLGNPALDMLPEMVSDALARSDYCVGTIIDGQLVSYAWRSFMGAPHTDKIWVRVGPNSSYNYKSYTLPEFRGQHIAERRKYCGNKQLQRRGINNKQSFIASTNYSSLAGTIRSNSKHLGYAGYLHLFGKIFLFHSTGVKKEGFEFFLYEEQ
ncbi:MAG: hypothetical protein V7708_14140 [Oceanicoccus sp.]